MTIQELQTDGYKELSKENALKLNGSKIELFATKSLDWYTGEITGTYKIFVDDKENIFLMKPRATRKGYRLETLNKPVLYKLI